MGCMFSKDNTIYVNNNNNYSSNKSNNLLLECYDAKGDILLIKKIHFLESLQLKKDCQSIDIFYECTDGKIKIQSFSGPFSEGQILTIEPLFNNHLIIFNRE